MARRFCNALGEDIDRESVVVTAESLIDNPDGVIYITDGACAGALIFPYFFNQYRRQAQELFWWVDEDQRGRGAASNLLHALERWAKTHGANRLQMVSMAALDGKKVEKIYRSKGYRAFENTFLKDL